MRYTSGFTRRSYGTLALLTLITATAGAQVMGEANSRKILPAEQAFLDHVAAEFGKILPALPAGWTELERHIFDAGGLVSDVAAPLMADYEWVIVATDIDDRRKAFETRRQDEMEKGKDAFEAATARNQKLLEDFSAKLEEAMKRNDQAMVKKLQDDLEKRMAANTSMRSPSGPPPELSDSYARIHVTINQYHASAYAETILTTPIGVVWAGRHDANGTNADHEGVSTWLIGAWARNPNGGFELKYTPNRQAVVYGIRIDIEARADRADALFRAMSRVRLQALLK